MAKVRVVETARRRPGKCAVSADTTGPFLDTGKDVPRYGRIYLSVKWVKQRLRDAGHLEEAQDYPELEELQEELESLRGIKEDYDALVDSLQGLLPEQEPEVREVVKTEYRQPTDDEIETWIRERGGEHPAVLAARPFAKGSSEEWHALYGNKRAMTPVEVAEEVQQEPIHPDEPGQYFDVHDQQVDLDVVLAQNVKDVLTFAEDKGEGFPSALARREVFVAEKEDRKPRKGVLAPLGFWNEDEDGPNFEAMTAQQEGYEDRDGGGTPTNKAQIDKDDVPEFEPEEEETDAEGVEGPDDETPDDEDTLSI